VCLVMERHGGSVSQFLEVSGIPRATLNRIRNGGQVSEFNKRKITRTLGFSQDIWDPLPNTSRPLRELEQEFFRWLDARGHQRIRLGEKQPIRNFEFLAATHTALVGRKKELRQLDDHIDKHKQSVIEIRGPSGSGKTELVRGWWIESGKQFVDGHTVAFSCRRFGTSDGLLDAFRNVLGAREEDTDFASLIVRSLSRQSARANLIILDDLDFLMRGLPSDQNRAETSLRFDRVALRELIGRLALELDPITVLVTSSESLGHLFEAYPGYLLIDLSEGLSPDDGSTLVKRMMGGGAGASRTRISQTWLEDMSRRFHGQPQNLVLLARLIQQTPKARLPAVLGLARASAEQSVPAETASAIVNLVQELSPLSRNFVRLVAAAERGLGLSVLRDFISEQEKVQSSDRVFAGPPEPANTLVDPTLNAASGLISELPAESELAYEMHLSARTAVLRQWRQSDPQSYERLQNWFAKYWWSQAFPGIETGFHPRRLPDDPARRLSSLLSLVESAFHLIRGAANDFSRESEGELPTRSSEEEMKLATDKVLTLRDLDYVFSGHSSPKLRVQFAYRRIIAQRVDRIERGSSKSKHRFGLTRRYGRHEEKMRLLSLLAPELFYGEATGINLLQLIEPADQGHLIFDIAHNALQLGWLEMARRAFVEATKRFGRANQAIEACRGSILVALTHMMSGELTTARDALRQAGPALERSWTAVRSMLEPERTEPERQVRAMDRRLQSFVARHALLTGDVERARQIDTAIHESARLTNEAHNQFAEALRTRIDASGLSPEVAGRPVIVPEIVLLGERGRLHIETDLLHNVGDADSLLGYWWACFQMAADDGVEVEHAHLHILEAAMHRVRGDAAQAERALQDGLRISEHYNVHFPVRLEWRLERARCELWFAESNVGDGQVRQIDSLIDLAQDYGFKLLECDGWIVRAWLASLQGDTADVVAKLGRARRIIEETNYRLRNTDILAIESGRRPIMIPLI